MDIKEVGLPDKQYPPQLREIAYPPKQLYLRGNLNNDIPMLAVVGSRNNSSYGEAITKSLCSDLIKAGFGIVSGLAYGIDSIAHKTALDQGGYTVAVMAGGLHDIYPRGRKGLGEDIVKQSGALVSEYPSGTEPKRQYFAIRNRIISGLSIGVIVIEAAESSGSLITAKFALEQNRQVMAVPGNSNSELSQGTNELIRQGAGLVTNIEDVLEILEFN